MTRAALDALARIHHGHRAPSVWSRLLEQLGRRVLGGGS